MNNNLIQALCKPPVYTKTNAEFWNDEYISKQMLDAHLNPEFDGASRNFTFIDKSVEWINNLVSPCDYPTLLDLGCGPGIYAEKFTQKGYQVTGMDFSERSIRYAKQSAQEKKFNITYLYHNYLKFQLEQSFDLCTMIYCDYGALSTEDRNLVLRNVYHHLKPGGKFLFDVFTVKYLENFKETQTWEICKNGGFWRGDEHVVLNGSYKYGNDVTLRQSIVISKEDIRPYNIWDTYFTKETLANEVKAAGFKVCDVFGDIAGSPYQDESKTIAILLER